MEKRVCGSGLDDYLTFKVHNQTMCLLSILGTFEEFTFHLHLYPVDLSRVEYVRIRLPRLTET